LTARDWRFLFVAWGPTAATLLVLKSLRIASLSEPVSMATFGQVVRSELFVLLGLLCGGVALMRATAASTIPGRLARGAISATCGLVLLANGLAHLFYRATGSVLTGPLLTHGWKRLDELYGMIEAGTSVGLLVAVAAGTLALQVIPWFVAGTPDEEAPPNQGRRATVYLTLAALFFGLTAWIPATWVRPGAGFAREPTLHIATTLLAPADDTDRPDNLELTPPTGTELAAEDDDADRPNLVFIILESTRSRSTTIHNPDLQTTPFLADLADQSLQMNRAYTTLPHTSKALVSIECGIPPMPRMAILEARPDAIPARCLPELLGERGYRTAFFQAATDRFEDRDTLVDNFGVDDFFALDDLDADSYQKVNYLGIEEHALLEPSREWLDETDDRPFFATYLTLSPHHDYRYSDRYGDHDFADDPTLDSYLNAVHYVDQFTAELVDQYRELGLYEDTVFFIFADHGEAFGEHGRRQHDNVPYEEGVRVPWLIHAPGLEDAPTGEINRRTNMLDILPTALEYLDFRVTGGNYPGHDVRDAPEERIQFFSCFYDDKCLGARYRRYKYIHHYDQRPDELFDLQKDPGETRNVADANPELVAGLRRGVREWESAVTDMYRAYWDDNPPGGDDGGGQPSLDHRESTDLGRGIQFVGYNLTRREDRGDPEYDLEMFFQLDDELDGPLGLRFTARADDRSHVIGAEAMGGVHTLRGVKSGEAFRVETTFRPPDDWPATDTAVDAELLDPTGRRDYDRLAREPILTIGATAP
jgi:arylsulfatase A-like enzyme